MSHNKLVDSQVTILEKLLKRGSWLTGEKVSPDQCLGIQKTIDQKGLNMTYKEKYQIELNLINKLFPQFQSLVTQFELDHHGTPLARNMGTLLVQMRERYKDLKERLGIDNV